MHPAYVILSAIRILLSILIFGFIGLFGSLSSLLSENSETFQVLAIIMIVTLLLTVGLTILFSYIYYKRFLWEITENDIHIYSGIIFKKQVHIPFQRVQSIDFNAPLFERVVGIVRLKIETAGGAQNRGVFIPALKLAQAEALRAEVFVRKKRSESQQEAEFRQKMEATRAAMTGQPPQAYTAPQFDPRTGQALVGASTTSASLAWAAPTTADRTVNTIGTEIGNLRGIFADSYQENEAIEYEYGLSARELFFSAISGDHNLVLAAVFLGLATQFSGILSLFGLDPEMQMDVERIIDSQITPWIVGGTLFIILVSMILGVLNTAITYGGFKARRRGGRIEVERGLIQRQYKGVSIKRVQSVEINQGFIRRLLGYVELKLLTIDALPAGQSKQDAQAMKQYTGLVIHPFVKKDKADDILRHILPEFNGRPDTRELHGLPKVALRRVINRHTVFFGLIYGFSALAITLALLFVASGIPEQVMTWLMILIWGLLVLFLIGRLVASIFWYRNAAYAYNSNMLTIRQGYFGLTTTVIPRQKIQWAQTNQNPFQRYARVASITAFTAAGVGGTGTRLRDVEVQEALDYLDWIRPRVKDQTA